MKKVHQISKVLQSIDHPVVRAVSAVNSEGKAVVRQVRSSSLSNTLAAARKLVVQGTSVSAAPDGFGSSTPGNGSPGGGKGGRQTMRIEDDLVPTSSVETAALNGRDVPDPLARLAVRAWRELNELADVVRRLEFTIAAAAQLQATSAPAESGMCAVVAGYELPWDELWDVREGTGARLTDFAGQLEQPFEKRQLVCPYVYRFVHWHKRLPERAELLDYLATKAKR